MDEAVLLIWDSIAGSYIDGKTIFCEKELQFTNLITEAGNRSSECDTRLVREGIKTFQVNSHFYFVIAF